MPTRKDFQQQTPIDDAAAGLRTCLRQRCLTIHTRGNSRRSMLYTTVAVIVTMTLVRCVLWPNCSGDAHWRCLAYGLANDTMHLL